MGARRSPRRVIREEDQRERQDEMATQSGGSNASSGREQDGPPPAACTVSEGERAQQPTRSFADVTQDIVNRYLQRRETQEAQPPPSQALAAVQKKPRKRPHFLSHEDRCAVIERVASGESQVSVARDFDVTRAAISHIYKHRLEILSRRVDGQPRTRTPPDDDNDAQYPDGEQAVVHELRETSVIVLLTTLRDAQSGTAAFRGAATRLIMMLLEEALGMLAARAVAVTTPAKQVVVGLERARDICGVALGDEGLPFLVLFQQIEADAPHGSLFVQTEVDRRGRPSWRVVHMALPANVAASKILLFTSTCATGNSECKAIETLRSMGVPESNISLVVIVCDAAGVVNICTRFPEVHIVTAAVESSEDPHTERESPQIGDFILRYNGDATTPQPYD